VNETDVFMKMKKNPEMVEKVKDDWYDLDHLYFRKNKDSIFYTVLKNVSEFPEYLEYFPKGSIMTKINYIVDFYLSGGQDY